MKTIILFFLLSIQVFAGKPEGLLENPNLWVRYRFSYVNKNDCESKLNSLVDAYIKNHTIQKDSADYISINLQEDGIVDAYIQSYPYNSHSEYKRGFPKEKDIVIYRNFCYLNKPFSDYKSFHVELIDEMGDIFELGEFEQSIWEVSEISMESNRYYDNSNNLKIIDEIHDKVINDCSPVMMPITLESRFYFRP